MDFDTLTRWALVDGAGEGSFPASWGQGRAAFGGAVTATAYNAAASLVDAARAPLTVDTVFLGPVAPDQPAQVAARVLRAGKYLTNVESIMSQSGQACARTLVTFALPRPSRIAIDPPRYEVPAIGPTALPVLDGVTPVFLQHFELTWAVGAYPFSGAKEPNFGGHCRHRTRATGVGALLGLLDAWPAPVLPLISGPAAASTVRWTAHLTRPGAFDPAQQSYFDSRAVTAHDGYATTLNHLYDQTGIPLAWTEQLVAIFET